MPQIQRTDPPYMQVVKHIREEIESGVRKDGDRIDSVRAISSKWKISLATATKVVGALKAEGLVLSHPGVGTVVTRTQSAASPKDRVSRSMSGKIYAANEHAKIKTTGLVPAPQYISEALSIPHEEEAIRRERITYRDENPSSASISWFPGHLAKSSPLLLEPVRIKQGTPKYIEETAHLVPAYGKDQVRADVASEEDADALQIPLGSPIMRKRNWISSSDGTVIEFGESVSIARRWSTYSYEISG